MQGQPDMSSPTGRRLVQTFHGDSLLQLPDRYIISNTFQIEENHTLVDSNCYRLNAVRGSVQWIHPPDSGAVLDIRYRRLFISIPATFRHAVVSDSIPSQIKTAGDTAPVYQVRPDRQSKFSDAGESSLRRSGSIFRGVTVGTNQGMRLQSGLRLQVSGQIAPGVDVTASLTDQNTPIQPEGNTQTLQEIDKVFVHITTESMKATLGDFVFDTGPSGFGTYSRKLQGAMGSAESRFGHITLIGAASKGMFTTNHFQGQESNQGPYQLNGSQGQREIIVLAGTERVWVDGETMVRGEDNDYVIEYSTGQLTFTRNRLITGDSRITVDFEYSDLKFQKSIYGALGDLKLWNDRIHIRTSFLREADDKDNPLDIQLTDDYRNVLESAGDNPDSAATNGAQYVGPGKGNYKKAEMAGVSYYQYVGSGEGDTVVRFTYVGDGQGEYSFQGYGIYQYEGPDQGSYIPAVDLPMARRHQVLSLQSDLNVSDGISLSGEMSLSDLDLNLYSERDDHDNVDRAFQGELQLRPNSLQIGKLQLGQIQLGGRVRDVGDHYRPVGRMADVEYGRRWGTDEGIFWGEHLWELSGTYSPVQHFDISGETGDFNRGGFRSQRHMIQAGLHAAGMPRFDYRAEWIHSENDIAEKGRWLRQKGAFAFDLGGWTPSVRYEGEHRKNDDPDSLFTGFQFDEWAGKLAFKHGILSGFLEGTVRDYQKYRTGKLKKESEALTEKFQWALKPSPQFSTTFMFTHRDRNYEDPAAEDQRSDLADMKIRFAPPRRWIDGQFNYQFSSTQVSELVRDTIQVQTGLGNYRFDEDLQELVPDVDGNLWVRMIQTGRFTPVNDLKTGVDLRWDGSRVREKSGGWSKVLTALKGRTLYRAERRDSERDFLKVNRKSLSPDWGKDSSLVMAMIAFHQDLEIIPASRNFSIRLRYKKNDTENNQLLRENLIRRVTERSVRVKGKPSTAFGVQLEYIHKLDKKDYATRTFANRDIQLHDWAVECSFRPRQQIEVALKGQIKNARDLTPDPVTKASSYFIVPRLSYAFRGRGHLRAELEIGKVVTEPGDRTLPYEMLSGDQPGRTIRWNVLMTYRLSGHVMATLNYRARREPWRDKLYQTGQVEVRAFF